MSKTKIFLTGASGFIGGSIFTKLRSKPEYDVTVFVRSDVQAKKFEELGSKSVVGTLDDFKIIQAAAENADVVIHTADASDHHESAKAIIAGLKIRGEKAKAENSRLPIYIHTSGTGISTKVICFENSRCITRFQKRKAWCYSLHRNLFR